MTATDVIQSAMLIDGVLDPAETASASELATGFQRLNNMIDSWTVEKLNVYAVLLSVYGITAATQAYTIGPGGTFSGPRPVRIESISVLIPSSTGGGNYTQRVAPLTQEQWAAIPYKSTGATNPTGFYFDHGFPLGKIYFYPLPSATRSVEVYGWQALAQFADLTTDLTFPPAYERALRFGLALEIAGDFAAVPSQFVVASAAEAKAALRSLNAAMPAEPAPLGGAVNALAK